MHSFDTNGLKNRFIVLEGIDGSGTTTQMQLLAESLRARSIPCSTTAEPTDGPIGKVIRSVLRGDIAVSPSTVAWLFAADRNEHLYGTDGILSKVSQDTVVISDRYVLSSLAYQGTTCGVRLPTQLNRGFPAPGLTILFDIDPEISLQRISTRHSRDIYETLELQKRIRTMYIKMANQLKKKGWNIVRIDAGLPLQDAHNIIQSIVFSFLEM